MKKFFTVNSLKELDDIAKELAASLKGGECAALIGELGSGKTTFVKALVKHLKGKTEAASPSFTLLYQ
ncbi:MAG: ATP-binding cassette domain-containing protein [Candidatus Dadabacteria bacterium]|nr:MAG: ATP-binding cassette domain-containing protein [Candidatus Dadabacteria bacterium]